MFLNEQLKEFLFLHIGDIDVQHHEEICYRLIASSLPTRLEEKPSTYEKGTKHVHSWTLAILAPPELQVAIIPSTDMALCKQRR